MGQLFKFLLPAWLFIKQGQQKKEIIKKLQPTLLYWQIALLKKKTKLRQIRN